MKFVKKTVDNDNSYKFTLFPWYSVERYGETFEMSKRDDILGVELIVRDIANMEMFQKLKKHGFKPCSKWYNNMEKSYNSCDFKTEIDADVNYAISLAGLDDK